ncbi:DUF5683 domain-containing protein [Gracilimonas sediminicola]|uniref:DUF5683 domain-containing protein n=1 Tax=Gracilimonas sediminicola TaxID=2952158 RepID=A0A9X2L1Q5_9BACT|nr:DUF5683 domain-containing protein [Gracilimonas sediminicola]MCP9290478.1 DUF5683 domain-containing protein [Gracilimonas sediminicola]
MVKYLFIFLLFPSTTLLAQEQSGFIKFEFNTDSAYVIPGNDLLDAVKIASGDTLKFRSGIHLISLQTHFDKSETSYIQVLTDSTVTYSHRFNDRNFGTAILTNNVAARHYYDANVIVLTDEDSDIYYNGKYQGTGFAKFNTNQEIGDLEIENPDFGNTKRRLNIPEPRLTFIADKLRPDKSQSRIYSVFPGLSQFYKKQHFKALLFGASTAALFTYAGLKSSDYQRELDLFHEYQEKYNNANSEQEALRLGDLAERQKSEVQRIDNQRRGLLLAGILIYGYNIYDAFTSKPAGGYRKKQKDLQFYLSQKEITGSVGTVGTLRYNF